MSTMIQFPTRDRLPLSKRVSQEVRALMGRYAVSQVKLAAWLGMDQTAVSARLRGITEWKVSDIERVAEGFAVHPASLMGGYSPDLDPDPSRVIPILGGALHEKNGYRTTRQPFPQAA